MNTYFKIYRIKKQFENTKKLSFYPTRNLFFSSETFLTSWCKISQLLIIYNMYMEYNILAYDIGYGNYYFCNKRDFKKK